MERYGDEVWIVNNDTGEVLRQRNVSDPESPLYSEEGMGVFGVAPVSPGTVFEKMDEVQRLGGGDWSIE